MRKESFLVSVIVISLFFIGVSIFSSFVYTMVYAEKEEMIETEEIVYKIQTIEYEVYSLHQVSFDFIIATVLIETEKPSLLTLDQFVTSQQIMLSDIDFYMNELNDKHILQDQVKTNKLIQLTDNTYQVTLFIPIRQTYSDTLTLFVQPNEVAIMFDLTNKITSLNSYNLLETPMPLSDEQTYALTITEVVDVTNESISYLNDEQSSDPEFPLEASVFAIMIEIESLNDQTIMIEEARLSLNASTPAIYAQSQQLEIGLAINLIQEAIIDKMQGSLLFVLDNEFVQDLQQHFVIELKLNTHNEWIVVEFGV